MPFGDARALAEAITPNTCAFLVEPIQGEAGIIIPPAGYLKEVSAICKRNNVLLMVDEIQSGLGRTGKVFASMHEGIRPDLVIIGKALAGGFYPVSAVLASAGDSGSFPAWRSWQHVWRESAGLCGGAGGVASAGGREIGGTLGGVRGLFSWAAAEINCGVRI